MYPTCIIGQWPIHFYNDGRVLRVDKICFLQKSFQDLF